jgi:predicted cupin superfamily sugar epimerase
MHPTDNVREVIEHLALQPHPEGGWYREWYRSSETFQGRGGERACMTSIYYLLEAGRRSRWHVVDADELWHFYRGAPLELLQYDPRSRRFERHVLSGTRDAQPAVAIARGVWQAARSLGDYSLVGCSVAPGFEFEGFRFVSSLPDHAPHFEGVLHDWIAWL